MSLFDGEEDIEREYFKNTKHTDNKTNARFSVQTLTTVNLSISKEPLLSFSILPCRCYYQ